VPFPLGRKRIFNYQFSIFKYKFKIKIVNNGSIAPFIIFVIPKALQKLFFYRKKGRCYVYAIFMLCINIAFGAGNKPDGGKAFDFSYFMRNIADSRGKIDKKGKKD
jgi:hypothetical protein